MKRIKTAAGLLVVAVMFAAVAAFSAWSTWCATLWKHETFGIVGWLDTGLMVAMVVAVLVARPWRKP